jgi:1-acyl-sn-glycerol-3-phosphate acyltransferase
MNLIVWMILALPSLVMPKRYLRAITRAWARSALFLLRIIAGTHSVFRGVDYIPQGGLLVAAKHQSMWETFALFLIFDRAIFILKRELMWIPLFGWYLKKLGMIPIDRQKGSKILKKLNDDVKRALQEGYQIIIFPEGTRRAPDAPAVYKYGIVHLYHNVRTPVLPIALNAGLFWPRRRFLRRPGTIIAQCMSLIPAGLNKNVFLTQLQETIETTTQALIIEGRGFLSDDALTPPTS